MSKILLSILIVGLSLTNAAAQCRTYAPIDAHEPETVTVENLRSIVVDHGDNSGIDRFRLTCTVDAICTGYGISYEVQKEAPGQFAIINGDRWEPACD